MSITCMPAYQLWIAGSFDTLKASLTLALRVVKHARSMFLINKKIVLLTRKAHVNCGLLHLHQRCAVDGVACQCRVGVHHGIAGIIG